MNQKAESRREALDAIGRSTLTPLVRQVLDDRSVEVLDWQHLHLQHQAVDEGQSGERAEDHPDSVDVDGPTAMAVVDLLGVLDEQKRRAYAWCIPVHR